MSMLSLTYSVADQSFHGSKSLGILNLSAGLLRHLALHPDVGEVDVLANRSWIDRLSDLPPHRVRHFDYAVSNRLARIYWDQVGLYRAARATGRPWLLLTKGFAPLTGRPPARLAVIMHDAMGDYYAEHYPDAVSGLEQRYFRHGYLAALRHADLLVTNSEFTRSEVLRIARREGISPPRTVAMGIGFDPVPDPAPRSPGAVEVLVLVNRLPHKRADLAIGYLDRWSAETGFDGTVHWVGSLPDGVSLPERERWVRHPRIPDQVFQALLNRVRCVVYTTEYEGFGMPPVEAVLAGACPVYSDVEATREVMQGAGCPFQNGSYESFAGAMNRALAAGTDDLGAWRNQLQQRYRWQSVADRVVEAMSAES